MNAYQGRMVTHLGVERDAVTRALAIMEQVLAA